MSFFLTIEAEGDLGDHLVLRRGSPEGWVKDEAG